MGTIARGIAVVCVIQAVISQVSSQNQQPITQYVLSNIGLNGQPINAPYGFNAPYGTKEPQIIQKPNLPLALSNLASAVSTAPSHSKPRVVHKPTEVTGPLDSNVLNNLAIALQLLIVSNIMNIPHEKAVPLKLPAKKYERTSPLYTVLDVLSKPNVYSYEGQPIAKPSLYSYEVQSLTKPNLYSYEGQSLAKPNLYSYEVPLSKSGLYSYEAPLIKPGLSYEAQTLPNANFLGSSGFSDLPLSGFGSIGTTRPSPRSSMTLMSPYDALGTSSFGDPLSFPSSYSKKDFQSPYASILAADGAKDLFSMSDLF